MNVISSVILIVFGLCLNDVGAEQEKELMHAVVHPNKNEYATVLLGTDKHKYGYELKENRQFHHTTTEEDGVRLGCYGYVLNGKKYSTQYVADSNGYRPVNTHDMITVYPKSGGERKASFVGSFNEDQQRSENIRYFFPDGCKGPDINIMPAEIPLPFPNIIKKDETPIFPPKIIAPPPTIVDIPPKPPATTPPTRKTTPQPPVTSPPTRRTEPPRVVVTAPPTKRPDLKVVPLPPSDSCSKTCCSDDENVAKLVLPVPMKNHGKSSGSCEKYAKLIIPVEGLNPDSLKLLTRGTDSNELIRNVLQSLS